MFRPPDFLWKCSECGQEIPGSYSETGFEQPIMKCPSPNCTGFLQKVFEKKGGPVEPHPFKKYLGHTEQIEYPYVLEPLDPETAKALEKFTEANRKAVK